LRAASATATSPVSCASDESLPAATTRTTSGPVRFTSPADTAPPSATGAGRLSPVSSARSSSLAPSVTTPSTGTRDPGSTRTRSPGRRSASATTRPSAVVARGTSSAASVSAADRAATRVRWSRYRPASRKKVSDSAASK
jgi:hypothetical protein